MAKSKKRTRVNGKQPPAPFHLGASDLSVITYKLVNDRRKSIIKMHLKPYWIEHVKGSVRGRCEFSGTIREYFWCSDFIPQILEDAIYEILQQTAETCPKDNLKWYVKEAGILLQVGLVNSVYDYMAHIDQVLRSKGNLKSVKRVEVYDDKVPKMHKLVEQYVAAVSLKAVGEKETTTAETGPHEKDGQSKTNIQDYKALNLANRTIMIGTQTYNITSERVWDFLKDLCSAHRDDRLVPMLEGATNNKNNVDRLRKQISNENLHKLIIFVNGGYKLNPEVKILKGGQIGIRKTHLSRKPIKLSDTKASPKRIIRKS